MTVSIDGTASFSGPNQRVLLGAGDVGASDVADTVGVGDISSLFDLDAAPVLIAGGLVLDAEASGVTVTNVAEALAGAVPDVVREINRDPPLTVLDIAALRRAGVAVRNATAQEVVDFVYRQDAGADAGGDADGARLDVPEPRLSRERVGRFRRVYFDLFGRDTDRTPEVRRRFARAFDGYREHSGDAALDPDAAASYFARTPEYAEALNDLILLDAALDRLESLGLTAREAGSAAQRMLASLAPQRVTPEQLRAVAAAAGEAAPEGS